MNIRLVLEERGVDISLQSSPNISIMPITRLEFGTSKLTCPHLDLAHAPSMTYTHLQMGTKSAWARTWLAKIYHFTYSVVNLERTGFTLSLEVIVAISPTNKKIWHSWHLRFFMNPSIISPLLSIIKRRAHGHYFFRFLSTFLSPLSSPPLSPIKKGWHGQIMTIMAIKWEIKLP